MAGWIEDRSFEDRWWGVPPPLVFEVGRFVVWKKVLKDFVAKLGVLGASWSSLVAKLAGLRALGPSRLILGPNWQVLDPSWQVLGPSWQVLGPSWQVWQVWGAAMSGRLTCLGG